MQSSCTYVGVHGNTHARYTRAHMRRTHALTYIFSLFFKKKRKKKDHANNDFLSPSLSLQHVLQLVTNYLFTADVLK